MNSFYGDLAYLDNGATTKPCSQALKMLCETAENSFANPSSLYKLGLDSEIMLNNAKSVIANVLGTTFENIYFTGSGTEANNLAIIGCANAMRRRGDKIISSYMEHSSVLNTLNFLKEQGFKVINANPSDIINLVDEETILVTMMAVNNEVGTIYPVIETAKHIKQKFPNCKIHCDCVAAFLKLDIKPLVQFVDFISISGHKVHAPKGIGALYKAKDARLLPIMFGGEQQKSLRPGTEPLELAASFSVAVKEVSSIKTDVFLKLNQYLRTYLNDVKNVIINSDEKCANHILNFSVLGIRSEIMLHHLEALGVYVSSGSACSKGKRSYVLEAMSFDQKRIDSAIRVSFSPYNTFEDIDRLIDGLKDAVQNLIRSNR